MNYEFFHDSHRRECRWPYGSLRTGEEILLRVRTDGAYAALPCFVSVYMMGSDHTYEMEMAQDGWREKRLRMPEHPGLAYYTFFMHTRDGVRYYGSPEASGLGVLSPTPMPGYQITIYDAAYETPAWAQGAVCYQIFPDRFCRSGERGGLERVEAHTRLGRRIIMHEDWAESPLYKPLPGEQFYSPCDVYGGDLQGIMQKLPYLASLGVEVIYLNPIFEAASNHKYDTGDYMKVDPVFGDNKDFVYLCAAAKKLGIRIILDGVFSHTGSDSRYFNREMRYDSLGAYQSMESFYASWYTFDSFPDGYHGWWGFRTLPEVNEMSESYQRFIARDDDAVIKTWVRMGASGWRLDVADELPEDFIRLLRCELKKANPQALLLGEVWEDASNKVSMGVQRQYVNGFELDSVMNYPWREAVMQFLLGKIDAAVCALRLERLREHLPPPFYFCAMNLLSSHDVPRALSLLGGAPDKDSGMPREEQANFHLKREQLALGKLRMRMAVALQMSLPGMPSIYYGDEAGLTGLMDPFNRRPYPWGREDEKLREVYAKAAGARKGSAALRTGRCILRALGTRALIVIRFIKDGADALGRSAPDGVAIAFVNAGEQPFYVNVDLQAVDGGPDAHMLQREDVDGLYTDVMDALPNTRVQGGYMRAMLPPMSGAIYIRR